MAKEYVEREAALKATCEYCCEHDSCNSPCVEYLQVAELPTADVVSKEQYDHLLRAARRMHEWIFLNSCDELEAYRECGLTDEDNALLGYIGQMQLEAKTREEAGPEGSMKPKEYIEKEAAIETFEQAFDNNWEVSGTLDRIRAIPAADVVEVRYCSFILEEARRRESVYKCSNCGNYLTVRADTLNGGRGDMNYCPFCGRKVKHRGQDDGV